MHPILKITSGGVAGAGGIAGSAYVYNHITTAQEKEAEHQDLLKKNPNYGNLSELIAKEDCKISEVNILKRGSTNLGSQFKWEYLLTNDTKKLFDWLKASEENRKIAGCGVSGAQLLNLETREGETEFWVKGSKKK